MPPTCDQAEPASFRDVPVGFAHGPAVRCAAGLGLVFGKGDGSYFDPMGRLTRAQFASMMLRSLRASGVELTEEDRRFRDIAGSPHAESIRKLAAAGIILGKDARTFDPNGHVTRGQVVTIKDRTSRELLAPYPDVAGPRFDDIAGSPHAGAIDRLNAAGVAKGLSGGQSFGPNDDVRRGQAASFLMRWLEDQADRLS